MNKTYIVILFVCATTALHSMEQALTLPDYQSIHTTLETDYKKYLKQELEAYQTTHTINMDVLSTMGRIITNTNNATQNIYTVCTNEGNTFFHTAVKNLDTPCIKWLCTNIRHYPGNQFMTGSTQCNNDDETPFDLCIDTLTHAQDSSLDAHKIIRKLIRCIVKTPHCPLSKPIEEFKEECLTKLINLHLLGKQQGYSFPVASEQLNSLVPKEKQEQQPPLMTMLYKTAATHDGNTFTHILVEQNNADELFDWIQQGRASLAKNNTSETPLDTALTKFRHFIQHQEHTQQSPYFANARCCLFMLLNWSRLNTDDKKRYYGNCCDKHSATEHNSPQIEHLHHSIWSKLTYVDYKNYAQKQLNAYVQTGVIDLNDVYAMENVMTGTVNAHIISGLDGVFNDDKNYFMHIAVIKRDLPTIQWLYENNRLNQVMQKNKDNKTAFDLCVDQLLPEIDNDNNHKEISHAILTTISKHIKLLPAYGNYYSTYRESCLQSLINLELKYKKNTDNNYNFIINPEILTSLMPADQNIATCVTPLYQQATDENGNTFTHLLIEQELPDELYEWIKQERISFTKNNAGQTPLDHALTKFKLFTENYMLMGIDKDIFNKTRCCLFMLLNYCNKKTDQSVNTSLENCCDKHTVA